MPIRSLLLQPWGIAVKKENKEFAAFVGDIVKKWHATGHIQELEKIWHIPPSVFAEEMHRRYADPAVRPALLVIGLAGTLQLTACPQVSYADSSSGGRLTRELALG